MSAQAAARGFADRLSALDEALALAEGRVDAGALEEASVIRARAGERLARGDRAVVAAFAGGTGTGKSTLFNAVAGEPLAETGVRRPLTDEPQALVVGDLDEVTPLLDWLGVRRRHVTDADGLPEGLVLVDLPDHDSVVTDHRRVSDRFVERVDLVVWVVDPLKYARRDLHADALAPLAAHADVLIVVMNHSDMLGDDDRQACADDLRRLLERAGLGEATVLLTSARTGDGVAVLRERLVDAARERRAAADRIAADVRLVAGQLRAVALGDGPIGRLDVDDQRLVAALAGAAGVKGRADAAARQYRAEARAGSRPLLGALLAALWGLVRAVLRSARSLVPPGPGSARAPVPDRAAPSAVRHAVLELVDAAATGLPRPARLALRTAAGVDPEALGRDVAAAVDAVTLRPPRRRWWAPVRAALTLAEVMALAGLAWLSALWVLDWLRLPDVGLPTVMGELPWPTALLLGGLVVRVVGGLARRRAVRVGAERHRRGVQERLQNAAARVARERVVEPLEAELDNLARLADALDRAS